MPEITVTLTETEARWIASMLRDEAMTLRQEALAATNKGEQEQARRLRTTASALGVLMLRFQQ